MRPTAELQSTFLEAAREIEEGLSMAGAGYRKIIPAITELAHEAYRTGGGESVDDLMVHAGQERIKTDIIGFLIAVGMRDVLMSAPNVASMSGQPNFLARLEAVVEAGHLTATRGTPHPISADPLSGYLYPGAVVHKG